MKLCSIKPAARAFLAALISLVFSAIAAAQPVPLQPNTQAGPSTTAPAAQPKSAGDAVSIGKLPEFDAGAAGLLTPANGGFPGNMWAGTDRALVEQLLPHLPAASQSPALQQLARRLLLSAAEMPGGKSGAISLLGLRASLLTQSGAFDEAQKLAAFAGRTSGDELLQRARADALLAGNELDQACEVAAPIVRKSSDVYWLKLSGFCQIRRGDPAAAQLTASLLSEQEDADAAYQALLAALIDKRARPPATLANPQPLHLAMMRMGSMPLPRDILESAGAPALKILAGAPELDPDLRLAAAEQALALGAIEPGELAGIYAAREFSVAERAKPPAKPGARANALMYQAVRQQNTSASRALALSAAWSAGRASNTFAAVALANLAAVRELAATPELLGMANEAGRALLLAGDVAAATRWHDMAQTAAASGNAQGLEVSQQLWPLLRLAHGAGSWPEDSSEVAAWFDKLAPEARQSNGLLMLSLLQALGFETPPAAWGKIKLTPVLVSRETLAAPLLQLLQDAGRRGRLGETVLLSLICLNGRLDDAFLLSQALGALMRVGLAGEARALAVEAAMRAGI